MAGLILVDIDNYCHNYDDDNYMVVLVDLGITSWVASSDRMNEELIWTRGANE